MTAEGRALSKATGAGFSAQTWLENDGDLPVQSRAAQRHMPPLDVGGVTISHVVGRGWKSRVPDACAQSDIVILNQIWEAELPPDCTLIDASFLQQSGSLAIAPLLKARRDGVQVVTAYGESGMRLWNTQALRAGAHRSAAHRQALMRRGVLGTTIYPKNSRGQ
jgi:competence protein ComEC